MPTPTMTPEALRERARAILDAEYYPEVDDTPQRLENALVVAFTALVAEARREQREALNKWGRHWETCPGSHPAYCTCGLTAALRAQEQK